MSDLAEYAPVMGPTGEPTHYLVSAETLRDLRARAGLEPLPGADVDDDEEDRRILAEALANPDRFKIPGDVVARLLAGEHVIRVLRDWRGMDQATLAKRMGTIPTYISQIETGARRGARKAEAFAVALDVPVEVIKGRL